MNRVMVSVLRRPAEKELVAQQRPTTRRRKRMDTTIGRSARNIRIVDHVVFMKLAGSEIRPLVVTATSVTTGSGGRGVRGEAIFAT